jgi:hypothetical protein
VSPSISPDVEQVAGVEPDLDPVRAIVGGEFLGREPFSGEVTDSVTLSRSTLIFTARVFSLAMVETRSTPAEKALRVELQSLSFAVGITRL